MVECITFVNIDVLLILVNGLFSVVLFCFVFVFSQWKV